MIFQLDAIKCCRLHSTGNNFRLNSELCYFYVTYCILKRHNFKAAGLNDDVIIKRVLSGEREAFRYLVEKYSDGAYNLAFRISGDREEAREIAQDSFVRAYVQLNRFRGDAAFSSWLYRIVYNNAISYLRKRNRHADDPEQYLNALEDATRSFEEEEYEGNKKNAVKWAMNQLIPLDRTIVTLYYHEGQSLEEIGMVTGIKKDNVKIRLHRARRKMRDLLLKHFSDLFESSTIRI